MSPNSRGKLQAMLMRQEGYSQKLYKDTKGLITGGYGHCFDRKPLSQNIWQQILTEDTQDAIRDLVTHLPWYTNLNEPRQSALVSCVFNLGLHGLLGFHDMLSALSINDWQRAHDECLMSDAADKLPARYAEIAQILLTGELTQ